MFPSATSLVFDPSTPSSPESMRALRSVQISPDRTKVGQELHSCVIAILADKRRWDQSRTAVTTIEMKHAFVQLGITDETILSEFSDPVYYQLHLPADEETLKSLDPDSEILETSFSPRAIVLICKIVKVLAVAVLEHTECLLSSTATFESLTKWAGASMQNPLMNEARSSSAGQTSVGNGGTGHGRHGSGTRDKVEGVKIKELKGEIIINGDNFLAHVRDQFNKQAVGGSFLTN